MSDKKAEMDASVAKRLQYLENALKAKENKVHIIYSDQNLNISFQL